MTRETEFYCTRPSTKNRVLKRIRLRRYKEQETKDLEGKQYSNKIREHVQPRVAIKNHLTALGIEVPKADISVHI